MGYVRERKGESEKGERKENREREGESKRREEREAAAISLDEE